MFACLHGNGNLTALGFEFSPLVEQTAPDTVTLDVSGLERLFGDVPFLVVVTFDREDDEHEGEDAEDEGLDRVEHDLEAEQADAEQRRRERAGQRRRVGRENERTRRRRRRSRAGTPP